MRLGNLLMLIMSLLLLDAIRPRSLILRTCNSHIIFMIITSGSLTVKMAPKAVTLKEESELQAMLNRLALEQEDVDGDEAEEG